MEGKVSIDSRSPKCLKTESHMSGMLPPMVNAADIGLSMETSMERDGTNTLSMKGKRGRPRKYSADGAMASDGSLGYPSSPPKRRRGRPRGSGKQKIASLGGLIANSTGHNFLPHVITVSTGEDVIKKISSFSLKGPRSICILSANGVISNITIRQLSSCSNTTTYEGRFEILSLSGSFTVSARGRIGGLSVLLAGPNGHVFGGLVAGLLIAASTIQIVVGSFLISSPGELGKKRKLEPSVTFELPIGSLNAATTAKPISEITPEDETFVTPTSAPVEENQGPAGNPSDDDQNLSSSSQRTGGWNDYQSVSE